MSFSRPGQPSQPERMKEKMGWEDLLKDLYLAAMRTMQENNLEAMQASCRALDAAIPPSLVDDEFAEECFDLKESFEAKKRKDQRRYRLEMEECRGGCPDLVDTPLSQPDFEYWESFLHSVSGLFDRKGLGLNRKMGDDL